MPEYPKRENTVLRPMVVIGLGGTGNKVVRGIKKRYIEAFGMVPQVVALRSFDTASEEQSTETTRDGTAVSLDPDVEFIQLSVENPQAVIGTGMNPQIDAWWPRNISAKAIVNGSGQLRPRGRLALFCNPSRVIGTLERATSEVRNMDNIRAAERSGFVIDHQNTNTAVYVISSLAGGCGSGMVYDIGVISRHLVGANATITGVFVLPWIFKSKPGMFNIHANTYAALKELDGTAAMSTTDTIDVNYGIEQISISVPPYDVNLLLDGRNMRNKNLQSNEQLQRFAAEGLFLLMGSQMGVGMENVMDNIKARIANADPVMGKFPGYGSFGVARVEYPGDRLADEESTKLAMRLLSDGLLGGAPDEDVIQRDVDKFTEDKRIREYEADDVIDRLITDSEGHKMSLRFQATDTGAKLDKQIADKLPGLYASKKQALVAKLSNRLEKNMSEILSIVGTALDAEMDNRLKRPHGLASALAFLSKLNAHAEECASMMDEEAEEYNITQQDLNFKDAVNDMHEATSGLLGWKRHLIPAVDYYCSLATADLENELEIRRREAAARFFRKLSATLMSETEVLESLLRLLGSVRESLDRDLIRLEKDKRHHKSTFTIYAEPTGALSGAPPDIESATHDLLVTLGVPLNEFADASTEGLKQRILGFASGIFSQAAKMSVEEALADDPDAHEKLRKLGELAVPLWRLNRDKLPKEKQSIVQSIALLGVEDSASSVFEDDTTYIQQLQSEELPDAPMLVTTRDSHALTLFNCSVGYPLFVISDLDEYYEDYQTKGRAAAGGGDHPSHLWKGAWEGLPELHEERVDEMGVLAFALGQVPLFEVDGEGHARISAVGHTYYIETRKAGEAKDSIKLGKSGRKNALEALCADSELVRETLDAIEERVRAIGKETAKIAVEEWVKSLKERVGSSTTDSVAKVVDKELTALKGYVVDLDRLR